jgi:hypothetical protein
MRIFAIAILSVLLSVVPVSAQGRNVLADGDPPLTLTMVNRLVGLMEWSLDSELSPDERTALRTAMVGYWRDSDQKGIRSIMDILAFEEKAAAAGYEQKQKLQPQLQQALLKAFEEDPSDPLNRILLGVYKRNHATGPGAKASLSGAGSVADIVGRWQVSHMNSVTTQNVYSGAIGDANGMVAEFDIKPNGRVIYSFYMSQVNYGCTTKIKPSKTGRVSVNGSTVTFVYDSGTTTSQDSCNAKYNYTKSLGRTTDVYEFALKSANGKRQFCFANSKLKDCAVRLD